MRVLSFLPAFFLATANFVTAAPASALAPISSASASVGGNSSDAALQPMISIIVNTTNNIQPLIGQLCMTDDPSLDAVSSVVNHISSIVSTCIAQLQATDSVDLTGDDLTNLSAAVSSLFYALCTALEGVLAIVTNLGDDAAGVLESAVTDLTHAVIEFIGCPQFAVISSLSGVLGSVITRVQGAAYILIGQFDAVA